MSFAHFFALFINLQIIIMQITNETEIHLQQATEKRYTKYKSVRFSVVYWINPFKCTSRLVLRYWPGQLARFSRFSWLRWRSRQRLKWNWKQKRKLRLCGAQLISARIRSDRLGSRRGSLFASRLIGAGIWWHSYIAMATGWNLEERATDKKAKQRAGEQLSWCHNWICSWHDCLLALALGCSAPPAPWQYLRLTGCSPI